MRKYLAPLLLAFLSFCGRAQAAQSIWSGASTDFASDQFNWIGNAVPLPGDDIVFRTTPHPDIFFDGLTLVVGNLTFDNVLRPPYTFDTIGIAPATILLQKNLTVLDSTSSITFGGGIAIVLDGTLSTTHTADVLTGGLVAVYSKITQAVGSNSIVKTGGGTLLLGSGQSNFTGGISVNAGTLALGASVNYDGGIISGPVGLGGITMAGGTVLSAAGGERDIANTLSLTGGTVEVDVSSEGAFSLTGLISGSGRLSVLGGGSVDFWGENISWTGGLDVGTDTIARAKVNDSLGSGSVNLLGSGAKLQIYTDTLGIGSLTGALGSELNFAEGPTTLTIDQAANTTFDGTITGYNGSLVKNGTGTLTLTGANSYNGPTTINAGTLSVFILADSATNSGIGQSLGYAPNLVFNGGTLEYTGIGANTERLFTVMTAGATLNASGSGALTFYNPGAIVWDPIPGAHTLTLGGTSTDLNTFLPQITDAGAGATTLIKAGAGTWVLTGTNPFTGGTTVNDGRLHLGATNALLSGSSVTINGLVAGHTTRLYLDDGFTQNLGGVTFGGTGATSTSTNEILLGVGSTLMLSGNVTYLSTNNPLGGRIDSGAITLVGTRTFTIGNSTGASDDFVIDSVMSSPSSGLIKAGPGQLALLRANQYGGPTTINAGTLAVSSLANGGVASNIGQSTNAASNLVIDGGTLKYNGSGASTTDRLFTFGTAGGALESSGSGTVSFNNSGAIVLSGTNTARTFNLVGSSTGLNLLAPTLGDNGTGATTLVKSGAGTWVLTGANTYTGGTTISAGTLQLGNGTTTGFISGNVANSGTFAISRTSSVTYSGIISGPGSFLKLSTGLTALSGINTYTGATTITGGTLAVSALADGGSNSNIGASSNAAANLVIDGGSLQYTGGSQTTNRLMTLGTAGGTLDSSGAGALAFTNSGSLVLIGTNASRALTLAGSNTGTLALAIGDNGFGTTSLFKTGSGLWSLTGANTFTGATTITGGTISISTDGNLGAAPASFAAAQLALNGGKLLTSASMTLDPNRGITVGSGGGSFAPTAATTLIYGGVISGSTGITHLGSGTLVLSGLNTYSSSTSINGAGAVLSVNSLANGGIASAIGSSSSTGANLIINSGTLKYTGPAASTDRLFQVGTGTVLDASGTGPITFSNTGGIVVLSSTTAFALSGSNPGANTLNPILTDGSGPTSLSKTGVGTWVLGGASTYTGTTTISGGTLSTSQLANGGVASNIGAGTNIAAKLVVDGATLQYTGAATSTDRLLTIGTFGAAIDASGSGALVFANTGSLALSGTNTSRSISLTGSNPGANTFNPLITNNGSGVTSLVKSGAGTWLLGNANTFTGNTTVSGGTLTLAGAFALQNSSLNYSAGTVNFGSITGATIGSLAGSQNLVLTNSGSATLALTTGNNNASTTYSGVMSGNGSLIKTGTGTFTLLGSSTYSGPTSVLAGSLVLGVNNALPTSTFVSLSGASTTLDVANNQTIGALAGSTGSVVVGNGRILVVSGSTSSSFGSVISGPGGLVKAGSSELLLTGANSYSGDTIVNGGRLALTGNDRLATAGNVIVNGTSGTTQFDFTGFTQTLGSLTFGGSGGATGVSNQVIPGTGGTLALNGTLTYDPVSSPGDATISGGTVALNAVRTFAIGDSASSTNEVTINAIITGTGGITKTGAGNLLLLGTNTYSGGTTISGGTVVGGNGSAFGSGTITLNGGKMSLAPGVTLTNAITIGSGGASFSGTGTIATHVVVALGVDLSPGTSPGTLNFSAGLTLASAGTINFEVKDASGSAGIGYDLIAVSGAISGPGTSIDITASSSSPFAIKLSSLNASNSAGPALNFASGSPFTWTLATATNGISNFAANKFSVDTSAFANSLGGGTFSVASTGTALTLNFTPVPEPTTWAMLAAGATALAGALRRRRKLR